MTTKTEEIYDNEIAPLLLEAIQKCQEHKIPIVCLAEYNPGEHGRSSFLTPEASVQMWMTYFAAVTDGNFDAFFIELKKWLRSRSIRTDASMVMKLVDGAP